MAELLSKYVNGRDHLENTDVSENIILKCISEKEDAGWIQMAQRKFNSGPL
jgi:hypothetical protein